jgi:transcriptional regulator with XRE-family HTH domain
MEPLQRFFETSGIRQSALADKLGVSRGYMSELVGGTKRPGLELAFQIEVATGGAVPARTWLRAECLQENNATPQTPTEDAA